MGEKAVAGDADEGLLSDPLSLHPPSSHQLVREIPERECLVPRHPHHLAIGAVIWPAISALTAVMSAIGPAVRRLSGIPVTNCPSTGVSVCALYSRRHASVRESRRSHPGGAAK